MQTRDCLQKQKTLVNPGYMAARGAQRAAAQPGRIQEVDLEG